MKRVMLFLVALSLLITGCGGPSTFIINKENSKSAYYLHRQSKGLYRQLCESGDFKKVLRDSRLQEFIKEGFYEYVCTDKRSRDKVVALYTLMSPEEKKRLKRAFIKNGYIVNYVPC